MPFIDSLCYLTIVYLLNLFFQIISQSKDFVTDVMGDDTLQKEGGDALWNSVSHALKPGAIRCITSVLYPKIYLDDQFRTL